jgi:lipopolysaccharide export LptBFGC system permease protein LptF
MSAKSSKIIRNYVLREILVTTILCTLVLTAILLYGNLSKYDEDLFRALSISPLLFLELISLMLPFALSLGLPFGFSIAVIFCVGRWSGDREILAMQSLGMSKMQCLRPLLVSSLIISLLGSFASLQWSPLSRGTFENCIKEMVWQDFQSWIDSGREIEFDVSQQQRNNLIGGLDSDLNEKMKRASLSIGHGDGNNWENVRILLWGKGSQLLAIIHAKGSTVSKDREKGSVQLYLEDVDYETFDDKIGEDSTNTNFVSFKKWKTPLKFAIESPNNDKNIKRMPILEFLKAMSNKEIGENESIQGFKHFNKYASIGFSPFSLCLLLISVAERRGRKETYTNLFLGVLVCMFYFVIGTTLGESIGQSGYGWWLSNLFVFFTGFFALKYNS